MRSPHATRSPAGSPTGPVLGRTHRSLLLGTAAGAVTLGLLAGCGAVPPAVEDLAAPRPLSTPSPSSTGAGTASVPEQGSPAAGSTVPVGSGPDTGPTASVPAPATPPTPTVPDVAQPAPSSEAPAVAAHVEPVADAATPAPAAAEEGATEDVAAVDVAADEAPAEDAPAEEPPAEDVAAVQSPTTAAAVVAPGSDASPVDVLETTPSGLAICFVDPSLDAGTSASDRRVIDKTLLPFASTSPWRLGVAQTATFAPADDPRNLEIARVDGGGQAWMNRDQYSHPVAAASASDPVATVTDSFHSVRSIPAGGVWKEQVPAAARIAAGTDRHMHVLTPDGQYVQEHFGVTRVSATEYTTKRRHLVSLEGSGIGPQNGTRAYGGSAIGGLIRAWEVDPSHPSYTGSIEHPLAIALRLNQLYYSGVRWKDDGNGGTYNRHGYGLAQGYVWPATEQDSASYKNYSGDIPMGSYFAIPPEVDLTRLGLKTPQALMLAQAAQDYGVYVTDASGASTFYLEDDGGAATKAFRSALIGPSYDGKDLKRIFKALKVVTSNGPETPNGGPLGVPRRGDAPLTTAP
jgi:hypothetical protein